MPTCLPAAVTLSLWPRGGLLVGLVLVVGLAAGACTSESPPNAADTSPQPDTVQPAATTATPERSAPPTPPAPNDNPETSRSLAQKLDDARLETRAKRALMRRQGLRVFAFDLGAVNRRVTLRGDVNTADQYRMAERAVRRVEGVEAVANELMIGGRPVTDERLRALSEDGGDAEESADAAVYHTVQRGESLWTIAQQYGASVQRLRSLNDLETGTLRPGQRIQVR